MLSALLLSTISGRDWASHLVPGQLGCSVVAMHRLRTHLCWGTRGKIDQRCTIIPTAQDALPTFTIGIQPSRLTLSISAMDMAVKAHTGIKGIRPHPSKPAYTAQLSYCCPILTSICIASIAVLGNFPLKNSEPDLPGLTNHFDSDKDHKSTINKLMVTFT